MDILIFSILTNFVYYCAGNLIFNSTNKDLHEEFYSFLVGAILSSIALVILPNSSLLTSVLPVLWMGAGMVMIMDASFNVSMEPFRALVADNLPEYQIQMVGCDWICLADGRGMQKVHLRSKV